LQELAEGASGTRDARHHSSNGHVEDVGDVFVFDLFDVAEEEGFAEGRWKLLERCVECGLVVEADEVVFWRGTTVGGVECLRMVFEEDRSGGCDAGAGGEKRVAEDAEHPGFEVGAGLEGVEGAEGFGKGLLREIFGFSLIASEPEGVIVKRREERERELLEVFGAAGWHGEDRLDVSEVGCWRRA